MGCENDARWRQFESDPTPEGLAEITKYYDDHFFGPKSSWQGKTGKRRVYIVFTVNTHIVLHRLVQANESLDDVVVVSVDMEDLASYPPAHLHTTSKSAAAYANLLALFEQLFYFEKRS